MLNPAPPHAAPHANMECAGAKASSLLERLHRFVRISAWRRDRARLRRLDDRLLADIGISRKCATREGDQGNWNAPDHWLR